MMMTITWTVNANANMFYLSYYVSLIVVSKLFHDKSFKTLMVHCHPPTRIPMKII